MSALEELEARHFRHSKAGDDQRRLPIFRLNVVEIFESRGRREVRHDLIVPAEPRGQRAHQRGESLRFIIDEHDDRPCCQCPVPP